MSSFLYKKIWHGISIHTRKCIPEKFLNLTPNEIARKQDAFKKEVNMELTNIFRPEFVNRIEHKVIFNMLTRDIIKQIAYNN